jgi:hypothetical protein
VLVTSTASSAAIGTLLEVHGLRESDGVIVVWSLSEI